MKYIKVWCEYDFGGSFGGNNNEGVFTLGDRTENIDSEVLKLLSSHTHLSEKELEGLYDWEFIEVEELK